jgi:hypothetical protein
MSNFYVSPPSSNGGLPESPSVKPELNERLIERKTYRGKIFPNGIFKKNNRNTLNSKQWGNTPFFANAKPVAMLERGWKRSSDFLRPGQKGLYTEKDGDELEVTVMSRGQNFANNGNYAELKYTLRTKNGNTIKASEEDRYEEWDFYTATKPVPFVPRKGGTYKNKKRKTRRKA